MYLVSHRYSFYFLNNCNSLSNIAMMECSNPIPALCNSRNSFHYIHQVHNRSIHYHFLACCSNLSKSPKDNTAINVLSVFHQTTYLTLYRVYN